MKYQFRTNIFISIIVLFAVVCLLNSQNVVGQDILEYTLNSVVDENNANSIPGIIENNVDSIIPSLDLSSPKIDSFLKQEANNFLTKRIPLIIQTSSRLSSSDKIQLLELGSSIKYEFTIINAVALSIDASKLDQLADLSFIKKLELDAETNAFLAQSTTQIGASRIWLSHNVEGKGVTIAILDTGIDNNHPDLKNVIHEKDFTGEGTDDGNGHGTHVASTAAGSGSASSGINKGVAPKASLMDIKVLNSLGSGLLSDTIAGIQYSVLNGADIISMSLGAQIPCNGLDATSLAADAAVKQGLHVIVAAGNTGPIPGTIGSPGCARDVITVGAVDRLDNIAAFSSRGPTLDGRTKPDIVAPGVLILAAQTKGAYTAKSGTSMATPHVSGVIALILSQNPNLSPVQLKSVLKKTALDLKQDKNIQGEGRIQAYEAFIESTNLEPQEPPKEETGNSEEKEEAKRKAKEEENVNDIKKVREKNENGNDYYVVDGIRLDKNNIEERIWVYVSKDTGNIDKVVIIGYIHEVWLAIIDFLSNIFF
jgi:subtilisin family serine protease